MRHDGSRSDESLGRPTVVDLYAGAGGLSLGIEQAGFDVIAAAEFDPVHALTHRFNFPHTPVLCRDLGDGSVSDVAAAIASAAGLSTDAGSDLDAVVGGPPCQGFSVGGVRDADDERNNQFLRFVDLVVELNPKVFCLENVAGLLEPRFDGLRATALNRLRGAGYTIAGEDRVLNAADFGVPQSRRRVLIMGSRIGDAPTLEVPDANTVLVKDALAGLPDLRRYHGLLSSDSVKLSPEDQQALLAVPSAYARRLSGSADDPADRSYPRQRDVSLLTNSLRTVHTRKTYQRFRRTDPGRVEPISRLFRLDPEGFARTLRAGTGTDRGSHTSPRPIHPEKARVITVREAARLHGYPDWFRFHGTNWHGHRQVGNSVPPPVAAAAGRALLTALGADAAARPDVRLPLGDPSWLWYGRTGAIAALTDLERLERFPVTRAS